MQNIKLVLRKKHSFVFLWFKCHGVLHSFFFPSKFCFTQRLSADATKEVCPWHGTDTGHWLSDRALTEYWPFLLAATFPTVSPESPLPSYWKGHHVVETSTVVFIPQRCAAWMGKVWWLTPQVSGRCQTVVTESQLAVMCFCAKITKFDNTTCPANTGTVFSL